jgi:AraC-like DNA-binding protein
MLFQREVGLPPKMIARIVRFEHAIHELQAGRHATLAEVAVACRYADQAHFNREFLAFAGESPCALLKRVLPDGTGIMLEQW